MLYSCQLKSQSRGGGASSSRHAVHPTGMCGCARLSDVRVMSHRGVGEVHVKLLQAQLAWFKEEGLYLDEGDAGYNVVLCVCVCVC